MTILLDALKQQEHKPATALYASPADSAGLAFYRRMSVSLLVLLTLIIGLLVGRWSHYWWPVIPLQQVAMATQTATAIHSEPTSSELAASSPTRAVVVQSPELPANSAINNSHSQSSELAPETASVQQESLPEQPPVATVTASTESSVTGPSTAVEFATKQAVAADANQASAPDPVLVAKFNQAVQEVIANEKEPAQVTVSTPTAAKVPQLLDLPDAIKMTVPPFLYQTHIYSSARDKRWIKLNNEILMEGSRLDNGLAIEEITPQQTVMKFNGFRFAVPAMEDWRVR